MDLSKSYEFFDPNTVKERIHIIGCGSVGSCLAELLVRYGLMNFALYDFDKVEEKNIVNQMFFAKHVGQNKAEALADIMLDINHALNIRCYTEGYTDQRLSGYVFLCVDNIELRKDICQKLKNNIFVKGVFDFRTRLTDAQHYAADWLNLRHREALLRSMDFTAEEAKENTPVSACGTTLGVAATVRLIVSLGAANFINFVRRNELKTIILIDTEQMDLTAIGV